MESFIFLCRPNLRLVHEWCKTPAEKDIFLFKKIKWVDCLLFYSKIFNLKTNFLTQRILENGYSFRWVILLAFQLRLKNEPSSSWKFRFENDFFPFDSEKRTLLENCHTIVYYFLVIFAVHLIPVSHFSGLLELFKPRPARPVCLSDRKVILN